MKRTVLVLTTASMASVLLSACDNSTPPPKPVAEISTSMESTPAVQSQEATQLRAENDDLRNELAKLQAVDPNVKDAYYGVDENGERVLHVVSEETNGASASSISSTIWPLLGGMAAGAVIAKMASSGGVSNYASHYPPARAQSFYSRDDERAERNRAYDSYRSRYQNQPQPKQAYSGYSNDRNSFNQAKPPAQVVQRTVNVAPSTAVASDPKKVSQYYAPTRQAAPASNDYSRQNTSTSYQSSTSSGNQLSTRIVPDYKPAATQAYKAPAQTYKAPQQAYKAPTQTYKAPAFKASATSGSRRR
jgi:hypothetical protein